MKKVLRIIVLILLSVCLFACSTTNTKVDDEKVNEVIELIDFLPNKVSLDDEEDVLHILSLYNALNEDEKKQVSNYAGPWWLSSVTSKRSEVMRLISTPVRFLS